MTDLKIKCDGCGAVINPGSGWKMNQQLNSSYMHLQLVNGSARLIEDGSGVYDLCGAECVSKKVSGFLGAAQ